MQMYNHNTVYITKQNTSSEESSTTVVDNTSEILSLLECYTVLNGS